MSVPRDPAGDVRDGPFRVLEPDPGVAPAGYVVLVPPNERIHFLDWSAGTGDAAGATEPPGATERAGAPGGPAPALEGLPIVLVHGLAGTAHAWAPVARRLVSRRLHPRRQVVAMDLRGHGLSDAPTDGYDPTTLAADVVAVAEGCGALDDPGGGVVLAGHGFGAIIAAWAAEALGARCAGLVLIDGGWEDLAESTGLEPDEFLRTLEEPPEVLASLDAFLADREAFDPPTWDPDQEAAARASVIELPAGKVVSATRPHALEACVRAMFTYRPLDTLSRVAAPIGVVAAAEDEAGGRTAALDRVAASLAALGRPLGTRLAFPSTGHNLIRYRPDDVAGLILAIAGPPAGPGAGPHPGQGEPGRGARG